MNREKSLPIIGEKKKIATEFIWLKKYIIYNIYV